MSTRATGATSARLDTGSRSADALPYETSSWSRARPLRVRSPVPARDRRLRRLGDGVPAAGDQGDPAPHDSGYGRLVAEMAFNTTIALAAALPKIIEFFGLLGENKSR